MKKERPILFNVDMVRAILDGRKTQTRRPIKIQPPDREYILTTCISTTGDRHIEGKHHWVKMDADGHRVIDGKQPYFSCPFGQSEDNLWVRETWQEFFDDEMMPLRPRGPRGRLGSPSTPGRLSYVFYRADGPVPVQQPLGRANWRPSIHMPRWASRITLEITSVRVERLQDISEADAIAEGVEFDSGWEEQCGEGYVSGEGFRNYQSKDDAFSCRTAVDSYRTLWDSVYYPGIYKKPTPFKWDVNPLVWVIEFKRVEA